MIMRTVQKGDEVLVLLIRAFKQCKYRFIVSIACTLSFEVANCTRKGVSGSEFEVLSIPVRDSRTNRAKHILSIYEE